MVRRYPEVSLDKPILGLNPGHDGAIVLLRGGKLERCQEAEHDSNPRHVGASAQLLLEAASWVDEPPAVVATTGWTDGPFRYFREATYHGVSDEHVTAHRIN